MFKVAIKFLETDDEILGDYLLRIDKSNVDYEVVGTIFDKEVKENE